ncbi:YodC family protein [Cupriavidus malaysiensis]|uniref:DUF2158 domain-containing protein n=1 Tax=Cupriavidus malaysiensis TaxID=367825 RepID=A0ABM6F3G9_9BURK|nr:DUF2158 domain-containing protein [Cupriavidus malaysiensis]AOZ05953.1 hypothetical protein BKK80_09025 [Cupriavidus malaysiensis]
MAQFKKGDLVVVKSGGPTMTVSELGDYSFAGGTEDGVKCVWFDQKSIKCEDVFDAAVLKLAPTSFVELI